MKSKMYDVVFEWHVTAGRELNISELVVKSKTDKRVRPITRESARLISKKVKRIFRNRWHEIYDAQLGIVHEPAPEPAPAPAPEPQPEVDPLEALREARAKKKEEEHE